jgi:hypothetical protein
MIKQTCFFKIVYEADTNNENYLPHDLLCVVGAG